MRHTCLIVGPTLPQFSKEGATEGAIEDTMNATIITTTVAFVLFSTTVSPSYIIEHLSKKENHASNGKCVYECIKPWM